MEEKGQHKARTKKGARNPEAEYLAAHYKLGKKHAIPAAGIKKCAVSACRYIDGMKMTTALGAFHVLEEGDGLVSINTPGSRMDKRVVRVGAFGNKVAMIRYRPRYDKWSCTFKIRYNSNVISAEQLINLYENAGFSVGLCEYRPEKTGNMGMFSVKKG